MASKHRARSKTAPTGGPHQSRSSLRAEGQHQCSRRRGDVGQGPKSFLVIDQHDLVDSNNVPRDNVLMSRSTPPVCTHISPSSSLTPKLRGSFGSRSWNIVGCRAAFESPVTVFANQ